MTLLLNTSIKVTLIVLVALAANVVLRRRSAAVRHFVLAAALACAAMTPALRVIAPAWQNGAAWTWAGATGLQLIDRPLAVFDDSTSTAPGSATAAAAGAWPGAAVAARALAIVWAGGLALGTLMLVGGFVRLARIAGRAQPIVDGPWVDAAAGIARAYGLRRTPAILAATHSSLVGTWGALRPRIVIPAAARDWPADRIRVVLAHELAHVRRGDWVVQIAAQALCVVYWFNPLVWAAAGRLRAESEQACDDTVLALGVEGAAYASELVDLARAFMSPRFVPAAAMARPSSLERRVRAMLNTRTNRAPITRPASIAAALLLVAVTILIAGFGVSAQSFSTVSGSLVDPLGRALPNATLTLSNPQAQSKYEIKSDSAGHYEFVGVPPGTYTLVADFVGFATVKREGIALGGQAFQQNIVMQVGSLQETITITDAPSTRPLVNEMPNFIAKRGQPIECTPSAVGGHLRPPAKIRDVRPVYPTGTAPGTVRLAALIGADGFVTSVAPVGEADPALAGAAMTAVNQWGFTPTLLDCQPIEVRMNVLVNFVAGR